MSVALLTNHLVPYRIPLYSRLAATEDLEVLCYGGGDRYMGANADDGLDAAVDAAPFAAQRLIGWRAALTVGRRYELLIAPYAGGVMLPAAYLGARRHHRRFVLWASVWAQPRSLTHDLATPFTRHIYRNADAVIAYGEHTRRYAASIRGRDDDIVIAPQSVEPELFGRSVSADEIAAFRSRHRLPAGPLVLFVGRLVEAKGVAVLAQAWPRVTRVARGAGSDRPTLVLGGDGPIRPTLAGRPDMQALGSVPREDLPVAYAAATVVVVPSIPTPRFLEPWGLVCNEAMHQGTPVIATTAVGAVAGGLVRDGETGLVVPAGDVGALAGAIDRVLGDATLRARLGAAGREAVSGYSYDAMAAAFRRALAIARSR